MVVGGDGVHAGAWGHIMLYSMYMGGAPSQSRLVRRPYVLCVWVFEQTDLGRSPVLGRVELARTRTLVGQYWSWDCLEAMDAAQCPVVALFGGPIGRELWC